MVRSKIAAFAFCLISVALCGKAVFGQTSEVFHTRLGEPQTVERIQGKIVRETFNRHPFLIVINYSNSGVPEELAIRPENSKLTDVKTDPVKPQDEIQAALDKIVLLEERGKYLCGTFLDVICLPTNDCAGVRWDYEKVSIYYNSGNGGMRYSVVSWRDKPTTGDCVTLSKKGNI